MIGPVFAENPMWRRATLCYVILAVQIISSQTVSAGKQAVGNRSVEIRSALSEIFADDHVAEEALQIHERAARLNESARFEFLARWVLPFGRP